jgi:putative endonuclease
MASRSHNLYIGVTNDIARRAREHKSHTSEGFTARYNVDRLVWYEIYSDIHRAIGREKQLKGWVRSKKIALIEALNPTWQDLSEEWGKPIQPCVRTADPSTPAAKPRPPPLRMTNHRGIDPARSSPGPSTLRLSS